MIKSRAQARTSKSQDITLKKIVKYYIYCKRDYHTEDKSHDNYFYLKKVKLANAKPGIR